MYCDGDRKEVKSLDNERETSLGVMQVNTKVHENVNPENFEEGVIYAIKNVLVDGYKTNKDGRLFTPVQKTYYGWKAGLRGYNGWGVGGDNDYVENVINKKEIVEELFPSQCSPGKGIRISEKCNLNFEDTQDLQYYVEVEFINFSSGSSLNLVREGNINLKSDCVLQEEKEHKTLSKCLERNFYSVDENNQGHLIKILSVIRKTEQNVK